jgi:hypothetical protein
MGLRIAIGFCITVLAAATSLAAAAEPIVRCTGADGGVTYQQQPCPPAAASRVVTVPSEFPGPDTAERDRLFQREAALDARLLKRAELDTAERIAREERLARERELDAATAVQQPTYLVPIPFRPARFERHRFRGPPKPVPIWR